jgi:hypothetical protein
MCMIINILLVYKHLVAVNVQYKAQHVIYRERLIDFLRNAICEDTCNERKFTHHHKLYKQPAVVIQIKASRF